MPISLIQTYKLIALYHGIGYQPLMRDILSRWAKEGMREVIEGMDKQAMQAAQRLKDLEKHPYQEELRKAA